MEVDSKPSLGLNKPKAYKGQGGVEFEIAGILEYVEDLKRDTNPL